MNRRQLNKTAPILLLVTCIVFSVSVPGVLLAAPDIMLPGSVVFQIESPEYLPQNASSGDQLRTGIPEFDSWLEEISATSVRSEFGSLLPDLRVVRFPQNLSVPTVLEEIRSFPFVVQADANYAYPFSELTRIPSDPEMPGQWHHEAIRSFRGWALAQGDEDIEIAIIDSGVDYVHPDLVDNIWVNPGEDLNGDGVWEIADEDGIDNDNNGYVDDGIGWDFVMTMDVFPGEEPGPPDNDPDDFSGHGTHCSGDAAASTNNGLGVASPGWGCTIAVLRAGWTQPDGQGVVGLLEATSSISYSIDMGFDVISMSFGGPGGDPFYFEQAMQMAYDAGLILVAAAGNDSSPIPHYPAANPIVVAVAATNSNDNLADFSSYGDWVTVSAPGDAIYSTTQGGGYGNMGGTSMACPIVAGVVAQAMSIAPPGWTNQQIIDRLVGTARPIQDPGTGSGIVDLGGLLDMYVSVDSVWTYTGETPHIIHDDDGTFGLRWQKFDQGAMDVSLTLSCDEPRVTLGADSLWIGVVIQDDFGEFEIPVTIMAGDEEVEIIDVVARFRGADFFDNEFDFQQVLPLRVGQAPVLLIDDDQGGEGRIDTWYLESLAQIGVGAEVVRRSDISVLADFVEGYEAIIYASGSRTSDHLSGDDLAVFVEYLDNGGKLLFSGQNIAQDLAVSNPAALDTLFHIGFVDPHANQLVVRGIDGQPLTEGLYLFLAGDGGAWNQENIDVIEAQDMAEPLFWFSADQPERLAGVRVQEGARDLVFCSFGIESINDEWINASTRAETLERIFLAWGFETGVADERLLASQPEEFRVSPTWPNPTNGVVHTNITLPNPGRIEISVVDLLGREVNRFQIMGSSGSNRIELNLPENVGSGMYFISAKHQSQVLHRRFLYLK
jgi:subtilisin family serine protease